MSITKYTESNVMLRNGAASANMCCTVELRRVVLCWCVFVRARACVRARARACVFVCVHFTVISFFFSLVFNRSIKYCHVFL